MNVPVKLIRPMLAASKFDPEKVAKHLPMYVQPKYDGIRALVTSDGFVSRTLKRIRNRHVQAQLSLCPIANMYGLDGELVVGSPNAPDVFNRTTSGVMSEQGAPDFRYIVFDLWHTDANFGTRLGMLRHWKRQGWLPDWAEIAPTHHMGTMDGIYEWEEHYLAEGYEGIVLRKPWGLYKMNRATLNQGQLIKVKRFTDTEAVVTGFEELQHNDNEATVDARGYTIRSSHKANQRAGGILGKLVCHGVWEDSPKKGEPYTVKIGSGFDLAQRKEIWDNQDSYLGKMVKFKYQPHGSLEAPRSPIFLGWRSPEDTG